MTGAEGYQWFLPDSYRDGWWDVDYHTKVTSSSTVFSTTSSSSTSSTESYNITCTREEMLKAVDGYMSLSRAYIASWDKPVPGGLTVEGWINRYNALIEKEVRMIQ